MEISYWQSRWQNNKTGWHMDEVFPLLKTFWPRLQIKPGTSVLVPLCGKSLDLDWLAAQGHHVIGVDVSKKAINEVMDRLEATFTESTKGNLTCYTSDTMTLWWGDFMKLRRAWLPDIAAIYDKAALIALPPEQRSHYASHLQKLVEPETPMLLNCFEYKQEEMSGPPFAVFYKELQQLYGNRYHIKQLHERSLLNELSNFKRRGLQSYLTEKIYYLQPLHPKP